jgi:hypothetical protein
MITALLVLAAAAAVVISGYSTSKAMDELL